MSQNKNALLRYHTIDCCLRNTARRWTLKDLVDACSDALYEYEGKDDQVSVRTVQLDLQMMRSDRLGYEAPIEVYERKYYRYSDPDYSISRLPLSSHAIELLNGAIDILRRFDEFDRYHDMADVVSRLQDRVALTERRPIVDFERNRRLKGLEWLNVIYDFISSRTTIRVVYHSFNARHPSEYFIFPYLLKEYRNRWFVFGSRAGDMKLFNFALDRILEVNPCPDIPYRDYPDFDDHFFDDVIGVTKHSRLPKATVRFWADSSQASYILTKPVHDSQRCVDRCNDDGSMTFEVDVVLNPEFYAVMMSFGGGVKVLSPKSAVTRMRDMFRKGANIYG